MDFNVADSMIISTSWGYDELGGRPAVLENKLSLKYILIRKNLEFYMLVTLELT